MKENITKALKFVKENYKDADSESVNFFDGVLGPFEKVVLSEEKVPSDEQMALADAQITRWTNQLAYILFRRGLLTQEKEAEFRGITPLEEVTEAYDKFNKERESRISEVMAKKKEIDNEIKENEIFNAMLGGMSEEEAVAKQEAYEQRNAGM